MCNVVFIELSVKSKCPSLPARLALGDDEAVDEEAYLKL